MAKIVTRYVDGGFCIDVERTPEEEAANAERAAIEREMHRLDTWTGAKHDPERPRLELVRLIRADIHAAIRDGMLPDAGYVVAAIKGYRVGLKISTRAFRDHMRGKGQHPGRTTRNQEFETVGDIIRPYNRSEWEGTYLGATMDGFLIPQRCRVTNSEDGL